MRRKNIITMAILRQMVKDQSNQCALTGSTLVEDLGGPNEKVNEITIDHKVPLSRGGKNILSNLQLVTCKANKVKHDATYDELLETCRQILSHAKRKGRK